MKKDTYLWDATAANRTMYETKDDPRILYTDIETDLSFKPDAFVDCRHTDFDDKSKKMIWFDPPHGWGRKKNGAIFSTPNRDVSNAQWPKYGRKAHPRYYVIDKYSSKSELMQFISEASNEFYRVLQDDGVLMVKWSESGFPIDELLNLFCNWVILLRIPVKSVHETAKQCWWILFMKRLDMTQGRLQLE